MFGLLRGLHANPSLRRLVLPLLRRFNPGDVTLRHHYTGDPLRLHSYRHKGYWFHGRRREQETMEFFRRVLSRGDTVLEVGGHIGYLSLFFADLVGSAGRVVVFEPGSNNLPYIRRNVAPIPQIDLREFAVSDEDGVASFFEEQLTGQNNSLISDYEVFQNNRSSAFVDEDYTKRRVPTRSIDSIQRDEAFSPHLIKIDVEGAELQTLHGAQATLARCRPVVMVEVTRQKAEIFSLLQQLGYDLYNDAGSLLTCPEHLHFNVCALHSETHAAHVTKLGWGVTRAA